MRRIGIAAVILCASLGFAPAPVHGGSQPAIPFGASSAGALQTRPAAPLQVRPPATLQVRPAPPLQRPPTTFTRPMPPLQRVEPFPHHHHHHHHGPGFVFVEPPFGYTAYSPFFYPYGYPYSSSFYSVAPSARYAPPSLSTPYYCWVDQIGFTDESRFAHHLHEVHDVPLDQAIAACEQIGERYVFFGY